MWTTSDELFFITLLGQNSDRRISLAGYLQAAQQRVKWAGMNKAEVISFAESELNKLNESQNGKTEIESSTAEPEQKPIERIEVTDENAQTSEYVLAMQKGSPEGL